MTTPVKFELAKLLKEKGYNNPTRDCYNVHGLSFSNGWCEYIGDDFEFDGLVKANKLRKEDTLAPTIAEVVMWLYEKHGIWIDVSPCMTFKDGNLREYEENSFSFLYSVKYGTEELFLANSNKPLVFQKGYNSPTEAYEAAIEYCLTNLI